MPIATTDSPVMRASRYLLQYLHDETNATWAVTSTPIGTNFPITDASGGPIAYLSLASDEQIPSSFSPIGHAVAAALSALAAIKSSPQAYDLHERSRLDATLGHGRVIAYFQPIVELETGNVVALESLARWQTADGVLSPDAFLDLLDAADLMFDLFQRMLEEAVQLLAEHRHEMPDLSVSVNLDLRTVPDMGLASVIQDHLERHDVRADQLTIELNGLDSCVLTSAAARELRRTAEMGVHLVVGDFTNTFELSAALGTIPIAGVKLNRRFVSKLTMGDVEELVVRSIMERAGSSSLELIAEGVETQAQCHLLARLGCKFGQGYFFAVPQSPGSLDAVLRSPLATSL